MNGMKREKGAGNKNRRAPGQPSFYGCCVPRLDAFLKAMMDGGGPIGSERKPGCGEVKKGWGERASS